MDIKILTSVSQLPKGDRNYFVIGTHNGIFHSDEVVAISILALFHSTKNIIVIRSRNEDDLKVCDICVDVGGGKYDHHQRDFSTRRSNKMLYASAGLIWKDYGTELIWKRLHYNYKYDSDHIPSLTKIIFNAIDSDYIYPVDLEDNGRHKTPHVFSYVQNFLPSYLKSDIGFEEKFREVLKVTISMMDNIINSTVFKFISEQIFDELVKESEEPHVLEIPSQTFPWMENAVKFNLRIPFLLKQDMEIYFVVFEHPDGGWAAQCIPPSIKERFKQKIPFPSNWAGHTSDLPKISGVSDATFCHNGCFFARAKTKEGIIKLCKLALKKSN